MVDGDSARERSVVSGRLVQRLKMPAGALPAKVVQKVAVGVIAVVIVAMILSRMITDGGDDEDGLMGTPAQLAAGGQVARLDARLTDLQEQGRLDREREARRAAAAGTGRSLAGVAGGVGAADGVEMLIAPSARGGGGAPAPPLTADEIELRERLRLEGVERRVRSLRASAVVQSLRVGTGAPAVAGDGGTDRAMPGPALAEGGSPQSRFPMPDTGALIQQIQDAAAAASRLAAAGGEQLGPSERTVPGITGPEVAPTAAAVDVSVPGDPAGIERVYEGSVLSAVLVTQLSGDFAGPVLAQVSIPFYSADRQRILVPRGARLVGTAQAVQDQDQSRLAVGFHRLIWPDGRWVDLSFHGLNAIGEGALLDQVNRHYWSMFAAAGAVGVIAGLTLQGANPYAGGRAGFQAGATQGLGQSSTQILNRFLNRLPTITIRAGHRLRVWVTSDFLVPRPAPHPERMFR